MIIRAKEYLKSFFDLFYPNICLSCSRALLTNEEVLCFKCESELPLTGQLMDANNRLAQRFRGRIEVEGAAGLLQFQKGGNVQHLLHEMKYRGRKEVGTYLGKMFGPILNEPDSAIKNIDLVVPVPLHWKKLKKRGYNQCDTFAEAIAQSIGAACSLNAVERPRENVAQAQKKKYDRWQNVAGIFSVKEQQQIAGKHVLIVDDIATTGATAEACMQAVLAVPDTKVSFLAMAIALE